MHTSSDNTATLELVRTIQKLQTRARHPSDVSDWLQNQADLLRRVSIELGHNALPADLECPAAITEIVFSDFDEVFVSGNWQNGTPAKETLNAKVDSFWRTDTTIYLSLIFSRIPELGISLYRPADLTLPEHTASRSLVFSPARWPMAASAAFNQMLPEGPRFESYLEKLLDDHYPASSYAQLVQLHVAGLFADESMLSEWLVANEARKSSTMDVVLPRDDLAL